MSKQNLDPLLIELKESIIRKFNEALFQGGDEVLRYQGRLCVQDFYGLRGKNLE